jgi:hypothetical protein
VSEAGPAIVYSLCLATSVICAGMLLRAYRRGRQPLLLWSALCFTLLAVNNLMVVVDMVLLPEIDFTLPRQITNLAAVSVLLFGFVWEEDR